MTEEVISTNPSEANPAVTEGATIDAPVIENQPSQETSPPVATDPLQIEAPTVEEIVYEPSGNASLDLVHKFLGSVGIKSSDAEYAAAEEGDFTKLAEKLKGLGTKAQGYEMYLEVAKQAREQIIKEKMEQHGATINTIHEIVGGEEGWKQMSEWVRNTASEKELKEINATLEIGGRGAILVAQDLYSLYLEHGKKEPEPPVNSPQSPVNPDAGKPVSKNAQGALSPQEFRVELAKLLDEKGTQAMTSPEYEQLFKRAQRYKG